MALDWLEPNNHFNDMHDATIIFLPGLTGDSKCEYVRATSLAVQKSGFRIVVFNYRGIGGIELKVISILFSSYILYFILFYSIIILKTEPYNLFYFVIRSF